MSEPMTAGRARPATTDRQPDDPMGNVHAVAALVAPPALIGTGILAYRSSDAAKACSPFEDCHSHAWPIIIAGIVATIVLTWAVLVTGAVYAACAAYLRGQR